MILRICCSCLLVLALVACQKQSSAPPSEQPDSTGAYGLYAQGKYQQSQQAFQQKTQAHANNDEQKHQYQLGEILSWLHVAAPQMVRSFANPVSSSGEAATGQSDQLQKKVAALPNQKRYYWQGKSFLLGEEASSYYPSNFLEEVQQQQHLGYLQLADILLKDNKLFVPTSASWLNSFYQGHAWAAIFQGKYPYSQQLFSCLYKLNNKDSSYLSGLLAASFLAGQGKISGQLQQLLPELASQSSYLVAQHQIPFQREDAGEVSLAKAISQYPTLALVDLLYQVGRFSEHRLAVWQKAQQQLFSLLDKQQVPQPAKEVFRARYRLAIFWENLRRGSQQVQGTNYLQQLAKSKTPQGWEARLALAVLAWKTDQDLDECLNHLQEWPNKESFWLGGRSVSLFRFASRQENQQKWQQAWQQSQVQPSLVLLDTLILLGEGRGAYDLLGRLMEKYQGGPVKQLFAQEEANIPRDAYADGKIWEKLY